MSKHNYTQYSKKNENVEETIDEIKMAEPEIVISEPANVESVPEPDETVTGTVFNCAKLNVRATPDLSAEIVCVLDGGSSVVIDLAKSYNEWYHVTTAVGIDGYTMQKYVNVSL